ncbi:NUDIX hydrolase [Falsibacillus albus]|uniref:NUDIX domain-containing protein n=1 Tax=Falsibacillus albus TaxID=2478915 RepID=A0A3L7JTX1_9BACI|nr:NUDIX domain-containing protein [Falsibacillus albus]RLQ94327.1 NUDIX domain-containing protein [Falsibacillus albus]
MKRVFGNKKKEVEYRERHGVYAVVLDQKSEKAGIVRTGSGRFFLPGGGIEEGETQYICLARECLEELGHEIEIATFIGSADQYFLSSKGEAMKSIGFFYLASLGEKVTNPIEPDHELQWMNIEDAQKMLFHEHQAWALETVHKMGRERR